MRCPPINLGSKVVIHNKRSMRHYSSSTDKKKINLRKKIINLRKNFHKNNSECGEAISINLIIPKTLSFELSLASKYFSLAIS